MIAKNLNEIYGTLSETLNELLMLGYTHDFNIKEECIVVIKAISHCLLKNLK
jgi:ketol-acid reductoisomerase